MRVMPLQRGFGYSTRSEVTSGQKYNGTDTSDTSDPVTSYDYDLAYDNIGNRLESSTGILPVRNYTTNDLNQYTAVSDLTDPAHDADGNMTLMPSSSGDWNMTWNAENRLIEAVESTVEDGSKKLQFTYDYKGRRVRKKVYTYDGGSASWSLTADLKFIYDKWNLIEVLDATDSNSVSKTYTWGLDLSGQLQGAGGVGGLLCVTENPASSTQNPYYVSYDANGNVSEYVDDSDSVVAHYEYSPFGKITSSSGSKAGDFNHRFSTKYLDDGTSVYYYGYRYYSNELGRWISRDPIGEEGGVNLYEALLNDPLEIIDDLGAFPFFGRKEFDNAEDAARHVSNNTNPKSRRKDREYCGLICQKCVDGKKKYIHTKTKGTIDGCNPSEAPCPDGYKRESAWHTHGEFVDDDDDGKEDRGYDTENFSSIDRDGDGIPDAGDIPYAENRGEPLYLATPKGDFKKYNPAKNKVDDLGNVRNRSIFGPWHEP